MKLKYLTIDKSDFFAKMSKYIFMLSYLSKLRIRMGPLLLTWFNFNPSMDK